MIVFGFIIFAVAIAVAIVAIVENRSAVLDVHGLGYTWHIHAYWVLAAGLIIAAVAFIGLAMMRAGAARAARVRTERRGLVRENARLSDLAADRPAPVAAAPTATAAPAYTDDRAGEVTPTRTRARPRPHLHRTSAVRP